MLMMSGLAGAGDAPPPETVDDSAETWAGEVIRKDTVVALARGQAIEVVNPYGSVRLRYGAKPQTLEYRTILQQPTGAAVISMNAAVKDGRYVFAPTLAHGVDLAEGQRLDVVLYVPSGHASHVTTTFGSIDSRDVNGDIVLKTTSGDIGIRDTTGTVRAQSDGGRIEARFADVAPAGSRQSLVTRTGSIIVGVSDRLGAEVVMSTSGMIGSDYSVSIEHHDTSEPDKIGRSRIGANRGPQADAVLELSSLIGEIRLFRIAELSVP
jgi:hypothetical protein